MITKRWSEIVEIKNNLLLHAVPYHYLLPDYCALLISRFYRKSKKPVKVTELNKVGLKRSHGDRLDKMLCKQKSFCAEPQNSLRMRHLLSKFRVSLFPWTRRTRSGPFPFVRRFKYKDVRRATDRFGRTISTLSHGSVYKAKFQDGLVAMVKEVRAFPQGKDAFYKEVQLLGRLHHRHLVRLRGFSTGRERFLVFEYTENGTLKEHLNDPLKTPLNWRTRLEIAIGVAAALEYLYFFCDPPVYHVSINSSNILLDDNFVAKLFDIGRLGSHESQIAKPHVSCSRGCMDQEWKNVVFQLGVLILELITGQSSEKEGTNLVQWIQGSNFASSMHMMVDPDLGNNYDSRELKTLLNVARLCTKTGDKPKITVPQILWYLQRRIEPSIKLA